MNICSVNNINNINFEAKPLNKIIVQKYNKNTKTFAPITATFVKLEHENKFDITALAKAAKQWKDSNYIQKIATAHDELNQFEIVLTDYKTPQLIVHASKREGSWDISVDRQFRQTYKLLQEQAVNTRVTGKVDITLFPMVSLVNNHLGHLFDYSFRF